jgi:hypothetical protein
MKASRLLLIATLPLAMACGSTDSDSGTETEFSCDLALMCQPIHAAYGELAASTDATCLFESLRDRKPGRYEFSYNWSYSGASEVIWILSDGTAARELMSGDDTGKSETYPVEHIELKEVAFFESCLSATTDKERASCLDVALQTLQTPATCP